MLKQTLGLLVATAMLAVPNVAFAELIYTYRGQPFGTIEGEYFRPGDFISGFVRFDTEPIPDGTFDADNVVDFEFSAGPMTIASPDFGLLFEANTRFDFDPAKNIVSWNFAIGESLFEQSIFLLVGAGDAIFDGENYASGVPGVWSPVPEPSTLTLWALFAMVGIGFGWWSKRPRSTP
ncbi:MAG: hypothetical protein ACYC6N_31390 [Pirellulaceae bacterium]